MYAMIGRMPVSESPPRKSLIPRAFLVLILLAGLISAVQGGINAYHRSQDFQWSGDRLLLQHIDPWAEYLRGDPGHRFIATQLPNYLPILYILIAPLGALPLIPASILWYICNLVFAVTSAVLAARFYDLHEWTLALVGLMLLATPTRITFGNGQQGLLVLFLWSISLLAIKITDRRSFLAGISYFKFNFGPPIFFTLLFRGGWRPVLVSALPSVIATMLTWLWLPGLHGISGLLRLIREPFQAAHTGYIADRDSNLMDVMQYLISPFLSKPAVDLITLVTALSLGCLLLWVAMRGSKRGSVQWQMAIMATISVALFRHHSYDAVVLLYSLCYSLRMWRFGAGKLVVILISCMWYFQRVIDALSGRHTFTFLIQFVLLMVVLGALWRLRSAEQIDEFRISEAQGVA